MPSKSAPFRAAHEIDECVAILGPRGDAVLRVFDQDYSSQHERTLTNWIEAIRSMADGRGWSIEEWRTSEVQGILTDQSTDEERWLVWSLYRDSLGINALYCARRDVGARDDSDVKAMIRSLRIMTSM